MLEWLQNLDSGLLLVIQDLRVPLLDTLFGFYTTLGNHGLLFILISLMLVFYKPTRKVGLAAGLALILGFLCTNVTLKHLVGRPRPWLDVVGLIPLVNEPDPNSFPSGHSCAAFAAGISWMLGMKRNWKRLIPFFVALLMALSRLYVGVHYPSDVICGSLVGTGCALLSWKMIKILEHQRKTTL